MLTSSFRVSSSAPSQPAQPAPQPFPIQQHPNYGFQPPHTSSNYTPISEPPPQPLPPPPPPPPQQITMQIPQPVRPQPPFDQFTAHMIPQLEADNYPPDQIEPRIRQEWQQLSDENRGLWDTRYREQMMEYETEMDVWKREQRRLANLNSSHSSGASTSFTNVSR